MDCGFETIGNATVIAHDRGPVVATDPWVVGSAYFGSWVLSHEVPPAQLEAVRGCPYVWISHGHPDHLSAESLELVRSKKILLPDHVGGRIRQDLAGLGFDVHVLEDRRWYQLSPRVRVLSIADYNQDAVLLLDVNGTLVVNLNDASDRGWGPFVRRTIRGYRNSFLLALSGYGDAGMINVFDEDGRRIPPAAAQRQPVGRKLNQLAARYGVRHIVPFSSMHRYQRTDSLWADVYSTRLSDYEVGFSAPGCELLPAFVRYDAVLDHVQPIAPIERKIVPQPPEAFGDHWHEPLDAGEAMRVRAYFQRIASLGEVLDFVELKVGGKGHVITYGRGPYKRGITFEAPRQSLLTAVQYEVFDDLLIGNFMKTTHHGGPAAPSVHHDFGPRVGKFADNGRARERPEIEAYLAAYRARDPLGFLRQKVERGYLRIHDRASAEIAARAGRDSRLFQIAKQASKIVRNAF